MKNSLVLLAVVLSVAAFAGMMRIKTDVQTMDRERMRLVRERAELRETKRVLEAEWALLASPDRLARLVDTSRYVPANSVNIVPLMPKVSPSLVVVPSATVVPVAAQPVAAGGAIAAVEALMNASATDVVEETASPLVEEPSDTTTDAVLPATSAE